MAPPLALFSLQNSSTQLASVRRGVIQDGWALNGRYSLQAAELLVVETSAALAMTTQP